MLKCIRYVLFNEGLTLTAAMSSGSAVVLSTAVALLVLSASEITLVHVRTVSTYGRIGFNQIR